MHVLRPIAVALLVTSFAARAAAQDQAAADGDGWTALFPNAAALDDWTVTTWNELKQPAEPGVVWRVDEDGVLHGGTSRGTWLVSKREYDDFELQYEFKLGELGNSGLALRAPMFGDPAFDGMELQMADYRYNPEANDSELTGGIYRAIAPKEQVYKPTEWNRYEIKLQGNRLWVKLNDTVIHDVNLDDHAEEVRRHDDTLAPPVKDRPRKGHIGFQELGRGGDQVQIRNARIRVLNSGE